jgi:exopolysaccharide biosynthesis predicted pyruvyltransferase EpsI
LADPILLLTKEKWLSIAKEASNKPKDKYLLTYFLGGIPTQYKKEIKKTAKENNLEIINLGDIKEKDTYQTGPSEFIDYINNCSVMFTDSFHGTVFSILFEKPFVVLLLFHKISKF